MRFAQFILSFLAMYSLMLSCSKPTTPVVIIPPPNDTTPVLHDTSTAPVTKPPDTLYGWHYINLGYACADIWFVSASTGFVAGGNNSIAELFKSADSGKNWTAIPNSGVNKGTSDLYFYNSQYGFGLGNTQLQITSDGGATWRYKNTITIAGFNVQFVSPSTGFYTDGTAGLFKTNDTGNHWIQVLAPSASQSTFYFYFLDSLNGYTIDNAGNFFRSYDQGATWNQYTTNLPSEPPGGGQFNELQFLDSLNGFYACQAGVFKTSNGGTDWTSLLSPGGRINILSFLGSDTGYYKSDSAIYKTVDGGGTWTTSLKVSRDELTGMHFINGTTGWACSVNGLVLRTTP
jgi:photosystem II stability/assembly factor-like uncharacterized protein